MQHCFGFKISRDIKERNYRFLEEAIELVQSNGCSKEDALQLVDYVFSRPPGFPPQEVGGVMVTLATLCTAMNLNYGDCGEDELARVWTRVEDIRQKHQTKPLSSPLPQ